MEWQTILSLVPLPIALGMVLYVQQHEKNCSVRELLKVVMERQKEIAKDVSEIKNHLMKHD